MLRQSAALLLLGVAALRAVQNSCAALPPAAAAGDELIGAVTAKFEQPVIVHVAHKTHAWFSAVLDPSTGPLVAAFSLGGDGTKPKCNGTCAGNPAKGGYCPKAASSGTVHCSLAKVSIDGGRSWTAMVGASGNPLGNEILPLGNNGTFLTLPYRVVVDARASAAAPPNTTAASVNGYARIDSRGTFTHSTSQDVKITWTIPPALNMSEPRDF
jgi:hypothetical protein